MKAKIASVIERIFGWGIFVVLFLGGATAIGFFAALVIGGHVGAALAVFLHKKLFSVIIYITSLLILFGLISMYLRGDKELVMKTRNPR